MVRAPLRPWTVNTGSIIRRSLTSLTMMLNDCVLNSFFICSRRMTMSSMASSTTLRMPP